jgi:hypothetical protein
VVEKKMVDGVFFILPSDMKFSKNTFVNQLIKRSPNDDVMISVEHLES